MAAVLAIVLQALGFIHGAPAVTPGEHLAPADGVYNFIGN